ncbi:hypothetical protein IEI94_05765 [Halomonas sp. ML-15]|uniref:hypothetical protein n=1 Tax=Halomonas sp. ML-15 TaxID=2773305 RepID=UPI001747954A|nr:hypothetical protein [Halomonas sp. ML-15]MBD3895353.1 hypothetical protein [Halomonas sp. ML-15]
MLDGSSCRPLTEKEKTIATLGLTFADHSYQGGGAYRITGPLSEYKIRHRGIVTEVRYKAGGVEIIPAFDALDFIKENSVIDLVDVGKGKMGVIKVDDVFDLEEAVERKELQFPVRFLEGTLGVLYGSSGDRKAESIEVISVADCEDKGVYDDRVDSEKFYFSSLHLLAVFGFLLLTVLGLQISILSLLFLIPVPFFLFFSFSFFSMGFCKGEGEGYRIFKVKAVMHRGGLGYVVDLGPLEMVTVPLPWREFLVSDAHPKEYEIVVSPYGGASLHSAQGLSVETMPEPSKNWIPFAGPACVSALALIAGFFMLNPSDFFVMLSAGELFQPRSMAVAFFFFIAGVVFLISAPLYFYRYYRYRAEFDECVATVRSAKEKSG